MTVAASQSDENQWPAVETAYDFVVPSYQLLVSRFEAADTRLTSLLTLVATFALGAPVFAKNVRESLAFDSSWFIFAMLCAVLAIACGVWGRMYGSLILVDPGVLYRESLHESQWEFKKNAIVYAGQHFQRNATTIEFKGLLSDGVVMFFILEMACFIVWFVR
jgi:hypothetical protein